MRGQIVVLAIDGPRDVRVVPTAEHPASPSSWSGNGDLLAYTVTGRGTRGDIWLHGMTVGGDSRAFASTEFNESFPQISPDGEWLAYVSNETGADEVFLRRIPDTGDVWKVSLDGGSTPAWSHDGRELYFTAGEKLLSVRVGGDSETLHFEPVVVFNEGFRAIRGREYDIAPDGRIAAIHRPRGIANGMELRVLRNRPEEMRRKAGGASARM